jgi:hypothetical protein
MRSAFLEFKETTGTSFRLFSALKRYSNNRHVQRKERCLLKVPNVLAEICLSNFHGNWNYPLSDLTAWEKSDRKINDILPGSKAEHESNM